MKLYDGQRSPNCRKIRLFAAELGIPLELAPLDFSKGELRSPEFLAKNPNGKIPTLDDDGFCLWESGAILRYMAAEKPEAGFLPGDAKSRARLDQWMFWWAAHVEPALLLLVTEKLVKPFLGQGGNDAAIVREAEAQLARYLPVLEKQAATGPYLLGEPSLLDFEVAPWLESAPRLGGDLAPYPKLAAFLERMKGKPYWKDA